MRLCAVLISCSINAVNSGSCGAKTETCAGHFLGVKWLYFGCNSKQHWGGNHSRSSTHSPPSTISLSDQIIAYCGIVKLDVLLVLHEDIMLLQCGEKVLRSSEMECDISRYTALLPESLHELDE
mmetsp:Transcript_6586/g.24665  ORF Transcript_6586/g.24665 Transcript_6586/m.24665 type:complete len:124 (-) Transcript_6586:2585-2956(-)